MMSRIFIYGKILKMVLIICKIITDGLYYGHNLLNYKLIGSRKKNKILKMM